MKKIILITSFLISACLVATPRNLVEVNAASSSLPTTIDLSGVSETSIRSYYSSLDSLETHERNGNNLLKNLKAILRNNFQYISYDDVWKAYEITDRDWTLSPAKDVQTGTYDESKNQIINYEYGESNNNPYVHCYYRDHTSTDSEVIEDSKVLAYGDHNATGINREHIWPQSHGFKAPNGASGPAGTDLHHLVAADGYVNQSIHNNYPYGNVDVVSKSGDRSSTSNNKRGTPKSKSPNDIGDEVFEPQDQDKGDIARACFYMVAMYNNIEGMTGVISQYDPNLQLVNYVTAGDGSESSSDTVVVNYGNLKDLLEWNKIDPVDEYEMHRNDLIYNNYEFNRNPFIDFPQWADYIWGEEKDTKYASPATDELNKSSEPSSPEPTNDDFPMIPVIIGAAVIVLFIIIFIIVYSKGNKKTKKKLAKSVKKAAKKSYKPKH